MSERASASECVRACAVCASLSVPVRVPLCVYVCKCGCGLRVRVNRQVRACVCVYECAYLCMPVCMCGWAVEAMLELTPLCVGVGKLFSCVCARIHVYVGHACLCVCG